MADADQVDDMSLLNEQVEATNEVENVTCIIIAKCKKENL